MKRIFSLAGVVLLAFLFVEADAAPADSASSDEVAVLLSNGGKITGVIVEDKPGDELIIRRADGEIFEIPYDKIDTISRDGDVAERQRNLIDSARTGPVHRMDPQLQVHLSIASDVDTYGGHVIGGTMLARDLFIGAGIGYEKNNTDPEASFMPVFAEAQYLLGSYQMAMVTYVRGGWALAWMDGLNGSNRGGARFEIGMGGLWTFRGDRYGLMLLFAYVSQEQEVLDPGQAMAVETTNDYMKATLAIAF